MSSDSEKKGLTAGSGLTAKLHILMIYLGYGNIAPVSTMGRIFCILYGLVGIPLFSVVASSLASLITR